MHFRVPPVANFSFPSCPLFLWVLFLLSVTGFSDWLALPSCRGVGALCGRWVSVNPCKNWKSGGAACLYSFVEGSVSIPPIPASLQVCWAWKWPYPLLALSITLGSLFSSPRLKKGNKITSVLTSAISALAQPQTVLPVSPWSICPVLPCSSRGWSDGAGLSWLSWLVPAASLLSWTVGQVHPQLSCKR